MIFQSIALLHVGYIICKEHYRWKLIIKENMGKYLIINADDFGLTDGVTNGIIDAFKTGVVSSTSVLINELIYEKISVNKEDFANLGIGLHLNLTQGRSILPAVDVSSLMSFDGYFLKPELLLAKPEKIHPAQVEKEWRAQIAAFRTIFGVPDHLDSHHHIHLYPSLFNIFCQLAVELQLPVRFPKQVENIPAINILPFSFVEGVELLNSQWNEEQNLLDMIKLSYPDHFMDNFFYLYKDQPDTIQQIISAFPEGTSELMCHPGYISDRLTQVSSFTKRREEELVVLKRKSTRTLLNNAGIELIRFSDLR
jgi:predicted glycoside hydrolase/deacetylase ChbG (UPF0249 family)